MIRGNLQNLSVFEPQFPNVAPICCRFLLEIRYVRSLVDVGRFRYLAKHRVLHWLYHCYSLPAGEVWSSHDNASLM